jgi:hypothetical protein
MAYLLDTNVFIQAKNLHYGFDFCPAFWDWLDQANATATVQSIEKVQDELIGYGDDLSDWAKRREALFLKPEAAVLPILQNVATWVIAQNYEAAAVNLFLQSADYYLISQAAGHGDVVVTHEIPSPSTKRIKIPNVCIGMGVKCMTPFEMLRTERVRFRL